MLILQIACGIILGGIGVGVIGTFWVKYDEYKHNAETYKKLYEDYAKLYFETRKELDCMKSK